MIFTVLSLFAGVLSLTAGDNGYSLVMCSYLDNNNPGTSYCTAQLREQENKYCDGSKSFFTEAEIGSFIDGTKIDFDKFREIIDTEKKTYEDMIEYTKKECGGNKICEKVAEASGRVTIIGMDASYDIDAGSYVMANTFNLGALCLGADPEGHFNGTKPIITKSIIDRLEELCKGSINMVESYSHEVADAVGKIDSTVGNQMHGAYKDMFKIIRDADLCPMIARNTEFQGSTSLTEEFAGMMVMMFIIPEKLGEYFSCVNENLDNVNRCDGIFYFGSVAGEIEMEAHEVLGIILGADDGNFILDGKGYDVYKASKNNPEYEVMTEEIPSGMVSDGLAGWAIALIVIAVLLVLGGAGVSIYFLVIKPKRAQRI